MAVSPGEPALHSLRLPDATACSRIPRRRRAGLRRRSATRWTACSPPKWRERPPSSLLAALKDSRVLICAAIQFGFTLGSYGIGIWLPLMLKEYHLSNFRDRLDRGDSPTCFASVA